MTEINVNNFNNTNIEGFEEVEIPVPWGKITGKWWGNREVQPIIAIHGWQDNCGSFDNLAPILAIKGLPLYCIDLPGHGLSSELPAGINYYVTWDGICFLRRVVKHFGWEKIRIIGHSLGGVIAFLYASTYPEEVEQYVSIDPPDMRNQQKSFDLVPFAIDRMLLYENTSTKDIPSYQYEEMVQLLFKGYQGSIDEEGCKILLKRGMKQAMHKEGYIFTRDPRVKVSGLGFLMFDQILGFASRIRCEVFIIRANQGIQFENAESYSLILETTKKGARKFEMKAFEGTHHLHLNNPDKIAQDIYKFLTG